MRISNNKAYSANPSFQRLIMKDSVKKSAAKYLTDRQIQFIGKIAEKQKNNPIDIEITKLTAVSYNVLLDSQGAERELDCLYHDLTYFSILADKIKLQNEKEKAELDRKLALLKIWK